MYAMPRFSSYIITGIVAGLFAIYSFEFPHGAWSTGQVSPHATRAANVPVSKAVVLDFDRSRKGARLSVPYAANTEVAVSVGSVEFSDGSVVYRDRSGRRLFRTDPGTNTTIILKNVAGPKPIARRTIDVPVREKIRAIDQGKPTPSQPVGCEAVASSIVDPTLGRLIGRCFA